MMIVIALNKKKNELSINFHRIGSIIKIDASRQSLHLNLLLPFISTNVK